MANQRFANTNQRFANTNQSLDQFYTKDNISEKCFNILKENIDISLFDIFLEPSAGNGSFFKLLPIDKREGIDLEPKMDGIKQGDFFKYKRKDDNKKYITIGNPPFGKCSSLAVKFFNHAALFSEVIAFIIPRTFKRISIHNQLNLNFKLLFTEDLPIKPCCFEPVMDAKCCFQIWIKNEEARNKIILPKSHKDFIFIPYGLKDDNNQPTPPLLDSFDFAIKAYGSNCGVIEDDKKRQFRPKSWHFIKCIIDIDILKKRFNELDYSISKDSCRQDSLGKCELISLYQQQFG